MGDFLDKQWTYIVDPPFGPEETIRRARTYIHDGIAHAVDSIKHYPAGVNDNLPGAVDGVVYMGLMESPYPTRQVVDNATGLSVTEGLTITAAVGVYRYHGTKERPVLAYMIMHENDNPVFCDCPESVLLYCSPTDNEMAQAWRHRSRMRGKARWDDRPKE